jgi:chemotaxis protein CheD
MLKSPFTRVLKNSEMDHFLKPGDLFFGHRQQTISTLLGSCVAVSIWHPKLQIGGMCHFVLPISREVKVHTHQKKHPEGYYGDLAFKWFEAQAKMHKTELKEYQAKVFGGSSSVDIPDIQYLANIGLKNVQTAFALVADYRLQLKASDTGMKGSRRVSFEISTGDVWVKHQQLM